MLPVAWITVLEYTTTMVLLPFGQFLF
jgi:hypothetical protein